MVLSLVMLAVVGADPTPIELSAQQLVHDGATHRAYAEGNAELTTDGAALHADRINWDQESSFATAIGHVALRITRGDLMVVVADVVTIRFEGNEVREVFVNDGKVLGKKGITPEALRAIVAPDVLVHAGETTMLLTGNHLVREGSVWHVEQVDLVPCECNFDNPSWSIHGYDVSVDTAEHRASLWGTTVRIHGVPVLWLPWISIPLSNRQTGLLVPKPSFTALNGFGIEQPVFITLGRSADLTLAPGYFGGASGPFGVRGPRLLTEGRYAPSVGTSGRLSLGLLWDLRAPRSAVDPSQTTSGVRGLRGEASWQHVQDLSSGWHDRVDAAFLSDGYYQRDLVADVLAREAGYLRSSATVFHRGPDHWLGLDVGVRQDLSWGYPVFGHAPKFDQVPNRGPNPLHRLPALTWAIPERPLIGPLSYSLLTEFLRLAPTQGLSGDEGPDANEGRARVGLTPISTKCLRQRLYWAGPYDGSCPAEIGAPMGKADQGDRTWQRGEREARQRIQLMPRLSASFPLLIATLTPYAAWRQGVWFGEASQTVSQRGYPLIGARLDSELYRFFGDLRHAIAPSFEVRGVPFVSGTEPAPYDEVDTAIGSTTAQLQAVAELRQRLTLKGVDLLRFDLGQGIQLAGETPGLGESYARLGGTLGWFSASVQGRVDPVRGRLTRLSAGASIGFGPGRGASAGYENLIDEGTDRSRRPIDLLFAMPTPNLSTGRDQSFSAGAEWRFGGLGLRYGALFLDRPFLSATASTPSYALTLVQHSVGVSYAPACDCFRLEVTATQQFKEGPAALFPEYRFPDFGATLTLSRFGTFGVSR
jgi:LPS-assembly protein